VGTDAGRQPAVAHALRAGGEQACNFNFNLHQNALMRVGWMKTRRRRCLAHADDSSCIPCVIESRRRAVVYVSACLPSAEVLCPSHARRAVALIAVRRAAPLSNGTGRDPCLAVALCTVALARAKRNTSHRPPPSITYITRILLNVTWRQVMEPFVDDGAAPASPAVPVPGDGDSAGGDAVDEAGGDAAAVDIDDDDVSGFCSVTR
jgi:hypothetical protein